jgi:hypothetical protein
MFFPYMILDAETNVVLILSIFVGLFVGFLTVMIAIFGGARYV